VRGVVAEAGLSIVTVSRVLNGGGNAVPRRTATVSAAHFSGARAVTRHLVELGHEQALAWIFDQAGIAC
jgi:DNA-binding LacI/PurR family transcriptional regulator